MGSFAVIGKFLLKHLDKIIIGAVIIFTLVIAYNFVYTRGKRDGRNEVTIVLLTEREAWEKERNKAADAMLAAEQRERAKEEENRKWRAMKDAEDAKVRADMEDRVRRLADGRKQLLDHIKRLANAVGPLPPGAEPGATVADLQDRLTACGVFFGRADDIAERCAGAYGKAKTSLDSCTAYADKVKPQ